MNPETPLPARAAGRALTASKIRELYNEGIGRSDVLAFWVGEPDEPTPEFIRKAGTDSIAAGRTSPERPSPSACTTRYAVASTPARRARASLSFRSHQPESTRPVVRSSRRSRISERGEWRAWPRNLPRPSRTSTRPGASGASVTSLA